MPLETITGLGLNTNSYPNIEPITYTPRPFTSNDVEIRVTACGICGSDIHTARDDWLPSQRPLIVGHEIIGIVETIGVDVKNFKVGDRVGVGPASGCCQSCFRCKTGYENNCHDIIFTYGSLRPDVKNTQQGGYASHVRVQSDFVFKIPDSIKDMYAAPLMCAGITSFAPLILSNVKKNTKVGICGIGGIGHLSLLFAKALKADVTAISSSNSKKQIVKQLGIDKYIDLSDNDVINKNADGFDVIVHTGFYLNDELLASLLEMLRPNGKLQIITSAEPGQNVILPQWSMILNNLNIGGNSAGSPEQIRQMLTIAAKNNIRPMIETFPFNPQGVKMAWQKMDSNAVRFRAVLVDFDKYFQQV